MDIRIVRKPNIGHVRQDRLKITLAGTYSLEEKRCQMLVALAYVMESCRFTHAADTDFYLSPTDQAGYPLDRFPDGTLIADHIITVPAPYPCAADQYDPKLHIRIPVPW